jgi:hypothetical protein
MAIWAGFGAYAEDVAPKTVDSIAQDVKALRDAVENLTKTVKSQQDQIDSLKQENNQLKAQAPPTSSPSVPAAAAPAPASIAAPEAGKGKVAQSSTPEIGAAVDIVGYLSQNRNDGGGNDKLSVREFELTVGQDIDPFTRFDSTLSFSDFEDPVIEEAYVTYLGLPEEVVLKIGRMRPKVGKESAMHRDQLDTVDDPLVIQEYLGTEGLYKTAAELSKYLPTFKDGITQELTVGVMEGGSGDGGKLFESPARVPSFYAHLKNFWEVSDTTDFELGLTALDGSRGEHKRKDVRALGVDATYTHYFNPTNKLKIQSEFYFQDRNEGTQFNQNGFLFPDYNSNPWGFYTLADFRLTPRWGIGARFDYVEPVDNFPLNPRGEDRAETAYLTFYQSEFSRLRLEYQHDEWANGESDNRFYLQGTYAMGVHKHKLN